ncbi:MAG: outer membrane beta-barrel protein [Burkholderiales bacterium]
MRRLLEFAAGILLIASAQVHAQGQEQEPAPTFVRGAFSFESSLGIEARSDNNIFESARNEQSSSIWQLEPRFLMRLEPARSRVEFGYDGDYAWYDDSSDDDYDDHLLKSGAYLLLGERSGLDLVASYAYEHDDRGTQLTQGADPGSALFPEEPDRYTSEQYFSRYTYGVSRTRAYLSFEASTQQLTYKNNETRTRAYDRKNSYGQATFGLRIRPTVSLQLSARARDIDYDQPRASGLGPDSHEDRYLLGVKWEATARTTGSVQVGRVERDFDDPGRADFSGPNWEVTIRWSPRTYSHFDLSTERYTEEPIDPQGDVTDTAIYSVSWSHEWNDRLESRMTMARLERTYQYVTGDREDQSPQYSVALIHRMRPWLRWELGFDVNARDSDIASYNYDQTIARLGAWITF